jgi:membrane-associated protease RseP (regulator of RpoE activity)
LALTFFFTTTVGSLWMEPGPVSADSTLLASPAVIQQVWSDPVRLRQGLAYSIPLLLILLAHELGHYLACRYYRLPATLPYFLPLPLGLGTLGAFIRIRAPIREKKVLFDVGIAGPLAGFAVLLPFLLYGIAHSRLESFEAADETGTAVIALGMNVLTYGLVQLFHGAALPPDQMLQLHPAALAAWVGLLATALNLIPIGQLDGGHIFYAAAPRWQHRTALPLWILLAGAGIFWFVWWVWCIFLLVIGLRHPPVRDEAEPLGLGRRLLALAALLLFVLTFMPAPVGVVFQN